MGLRVGRDDGGKVGIMDGYPVGRRLGIIAGSEGVTDGDRLGVIEGIAVAMIGCCY